MCLVLLGGVWEPMVKWRTHMFTIFTPFFTLGPTSTTLYSTHAVSHGLISSTTFLQHSATLYSLQLYSSSTVYNLYNTPLTSAGRILDARLSSQPPHTEHDDARTRPAGRTIPQSDDEPGVAYTSSGVVPEITSSARYLSGTPRAVHAMPTALVAPMPLSLSLITICNACVTFSLLPNSLWPRDCRKNNNLLLRPGQ